MIYLQKNAFIILVALNCINIYHITCVVFHVTIFKDFFRPHLRSYRAIRALRARHSRPRDLGQLLEELETLQEQFAPYRANYIRMLRAANNPEVCVLRMRAL